ncbi:16S rRNA (cytosine(1402)-N(4))-methyltransferase RsmH [Engelhardtia mirabilis]|uniref:16S rRNA (cytosine(1402)-N(4))-methyltransferase RsmH n=1 Tax=Engelhardtia mirabilis TaxID=2528011 RepID=UPI003AF3F82C
MAERQPVHSPVLVAPILAACERVLGTDPRGWFADATVGAGGHLTAALERFEGLCGVGFDWDPDSLAEARANLEPFGDRVRLARSAFAELESGLAATEVERPLAVLADLGVCSLHFDRPERGFSALKDGPLDMRMSPDVELTAAEIVNSWSEERLADLFFIEGGERRSRRAAAAVVEARRRVPFQRTMALAETVERALGPGGKVHAATRVFQALRRAVNDEGGQLEHGLAAAERALAPGGLLAIISFHSGEDGVVKRFLAAAAKAGRFESDGNKPVGPERSEALANPRSRSARLRTARRTDVPAPAEERP